MPELPEVETTLRGIEPWLENQTIRAIEVRDPRLRWPVTDAVQNACGQQVLSLQRRAKYILLHFSSGSLLIHLGMSGSIRVLTEESSSVNDDPQKYDPKKHDPKKHDHWDIVLDNCLVRFNDPRRFGSFLWLEKPVMDHPLLASLGPEPLSDGFTGKYLHQRSRGRKVAIKNFIMDGKVVVGIGNIYASEALFMAGIHPSRAAGRVSAARLDGLVDAICDVLDRAIRQGGTTLRDFANSDGSPGYFAQELLVYGRGGEDCFQCGSQIRQKVIGQRSSFYCIQCQR
jgi:formamidopyrimidine-DNA glycosylase